VRWGLNVNGSRWEYVSVNALAGSGAHVCDTAVSERARVLGGCGWVAGFGEVMSRRGEVFCRCVQVGRLGFPHTQVLGRCGQARRVDIKPGDLKPADNTER
jgi:hypothetical protein